jgi:hypothetical protein
MVGRSKEVAILLRNCDFFKNYIQRERGIPRSWGIHLKSLKDNNADEICWRLESLRNLENKKINEHFTDTNSNSHINKYIIVALVILIILYFLGITNNKFIQI